MSNKKLWFYHDPIVFSSCPWPTNVQMAQRLDTFAPTASNDINQ